MNRENKELKQIAVIETPKVAEDTYSSQRIIQNIVTDLLDKVDKSLMKKQAQSRFKETIKQFSKTKLVKNINEIDKLNQYQLSSSPNSFVAGKEPKALQIDSLLPISASIDEENTYKKNLKNQIDFNPENMTPIKKHRIKKQSGEIYHKLELEETQEDGFTKQLRKMQEEKVSKLQAQQKAKKIEAQILEAKLKDKKDKKKQQKFSFDYNCSKIEIRSQNRKNLISKLVNDKVNNNTKIIKEAFNDKNPSTIEQYTSKGKKKGNQLLNLKKKDEVQFNENRSLDQGIEAKVGVKYTYEGKTKQGKKKVLSVAALKKSMHERMLSKQQFALVKTLNGSQESLTPQLTKTNTTTMHKRSQSESNLLTTIREKRQKIIVNNQTLKKKFLEKVPEYLDENEPKTPSKINQKSSIELGFTDVFNMNYLKSGGKGKSENDQPTLASSAKSFSFLPKIYHTNASSPYLPKQREKLKERALMIRDLRKKFDDKLRT